MAMPKMHLMITIEDENLNKKQKDTFKKNIRQKTKINRMCPKVKCTPKVRQKTFGVYYVKKEETWFCRVLEVHASD